jgi:hypothetical protein
MFDNQPTVTYAHKDAPNGTRFRAFATDKIPAWAVDVEAEDPNTDQFGLPKNVQELRRELGKASVGACNCGAGSPNSADHVYACRYRAIDLAMQYLDKQCTSIPEISCSLGCKTECLAQMHGVPSECTRRRA